MPMWQFSREGREFRVRGESASAVAKIFLATQRILECHPLPDRPAGAEVWVLQDLRAHPLRRRAGSILLSRIIESADRRGAWIVLNCLADELSPDELVAFYQRFGFEQPDPEDDRMFRRPRGSDQQVGREIERAHCARSG